jgi:hypothetical protein
LTYQQFLPEYQQSSYSCEEYNCSLNHRISVSTIGNNRTIYGGTVRLSVPPADSIIESCSPEVLGLFRWRTTKSNLTISMSQHFLYLNNIYIYVSFPAVHRLPVFSRHTCRFTPSSHVKFPCFITLSISFPHCSRFVLVLVFLPVTSTLLS